LNSIQFIYKIFNYIKNYFPLVFLFKLKEINKLNKNLIVDKKKNIIHFFLDFFIQEK
jgi:hypothetical protein